MKPKPKLISPITALSITAALAISGPVHGAITWDPVPTTNLGANTPFTFTNSELNPLVSDVELDFTSSHAGGIETGTFAGRIIYKNDALISAGETISFNFDFNFQLASGSSVTYQDRYASALFSTLLVDGTANLTMYGGNDTLQNYFGTSASAPSLPTMGHTNVDVLEFNVDGAMANPLASTLNSFTSANSISLTEGINTSQTQVGLTDENLFNQDFSFSGWQFDYTSNVDIAAGTLFLFTLDGVNSGPAIVPEPASTSLLGLGALVVALRRRKSLKSRSQLLGKLK